MRWIRHVLSLNYITGYMKQNYLHSFWFDDYSISIIHNILTHSSERIWTLLKVNDINNLSCFAETPLLLRVDIIALNKAHILFHHMWFRNPIMELGDLLWISGILWKKTVPDNYLISYILNFNMGLKGPKLLQKWIYLKYTTKFQ